MLANTELLLLIPSEMMKDHGIFLSIDLYRTVLAGGVRNASEMQQRLHSNHMGVLIDWGLLIDECDVLRNLVGAVSRTTRPSSYPLPTTRHGRKRAGYNAEDTLNPSSIR